MCKKANFSPIEFIKTTNLSDVSNVLKGTINSFHSKVINKFPFLCACFYLINTANVIKQRVPFLLNSKCNE